MKKYTIYKGKKTIKLTNEQIMKYQNFDKLFVSYNELTKRKNPPIMVGFKNVQCSGYACSSSWARTKDPLINSQ